MIESPASYAVCVVAIDDEVVHNWVVYGLRAAGLHPRRASDRAELFAALADEPFALIVGGRFDRSPAAALVAQIRGAGCRVPVLVLDPTLSGGRLRAPAFAPLVTLGGSLDSRDLLLALVDLHQARDPGPRAVRHREDAAASAF